MSSEQLILSVYNRRALWNASHPDHRNRYVVDKFWSEVAEECRITAKAAQNKWKNLKDYFRRELKKVPLPRSGDPGDIADKSHWPYFQSLLFLKDQFLPRPSTSNLVESEDSQATVLPLQSDADSDNQIEEKTTETMNDDSLMSVPTPSSSSTHVEPRTIIHNRLRKRKNPADALVDIELQKLQLLKEKRVQLSVPTDPPADEHQQFFNSLLPHVRKIQEGSIMQFRNEVQNLVQRYAYDHRTFSTFSYESDNGRGSDPRNVYFAE